MNLHELFQNQLFSGGFLLMISGAVMALLRQVPSNIYNWLKYRLSVSVSITDREPLFEWTKLWLDTLPYAKRARNVSCSLYRESDEELTLDSRLLFTPDYGSHFFRHGSKLVWLSRDKPNAPTPGQATVGSASMPEVIKLTVFGIRQQVIRDLVQEIRQFAAKDEQRKARGYISGHGWWRRLPTFQPRLLETVYLPQEHERQILGAIADFLQARALYAQRGIPYHLNFLFAGLPGTGKTSIASALCGHFGLNLHLLNIAGPRMNDDRLVELMLSLPRRSMVLMEDVDAIVPERKTKPKTAGPQSASDGTPTAAAPEDSEGVTLSGLLNCMDGITAPDGAVIVMTTNHPELIDPALLRPGRVDVRVDFGAATREQIERMCNRLNPKRKLNGAVESMLMQRYTTAQAQAAILSDYHQ